MGQSKRIRRTAGTWRKLFSRQSNSGLSVVAFCRREGINPGLFHRWRLMLKDSGKGHRVAVRPEAARVSAPFIDLGDFRPGGARFEVRLELGAGVILHIARG